MTPNPVAEALQSRAGLDPRLLEGVGFRQIVADRMTRLGLTTEEEYAAHLLDDDIESELLIGRVSVPETWLFRYPASFELLVEHLRRRERPGERHEGRAAPTLLLSVACAAGQEAFSMAAAALHAGCDPSTTRIVAIDRNPDQIARARSGEVHEPVPRDRMPEWAERWFRRQGSSHLVDDRLRSIIDFQVADALTVPLATGSFAAVFCRNLLIYLCDAARGHLLSRLIQALEPGGLLLLGHADRAADSTEPLERTGPPQSFAFVRRAARSEPEVERPMVAGGSPAAALRTDSPARAATSGRTVRSGSGSGSGSPRGPEPAAGPSRAPIDLETAQRLADDGQLDQAAAMVRALIAREGQSSGSAEILGLVALARGDLPAARRHFEEAVYLEPRRASALLHLSLLLERLGERARAASMRARAARVDAAASSAGS